MPMALYEEYGTPAAGFDIEVLESTAESVFEALPSVLLLEHCVSGGLSRVHFQMERPLHQGMATSSIFATVMEERIDEPEPIMVFAFAPDGSVEHDADEGRGEDEAKQVRQTAHELIVDILRINRLDMDTRQALQLIDSLTHPDVGGLSGERLAVDFIRDLVVEHDDSSIEVRVFEHEFDDGHGQLNIRQTRLLHPNHPLRRSIIPLEINYFDDSGDSAFHYRKTVGGNRILKALAIGDDDQEVDALAFRLDDTSGWESDDLRKSHWPRQERVHMLAAKLGALFLEDNSGSIELGS
jgi:hypothetical protein